MKTKSASLRVSACCGCRTWLRLRQSHAQTWEPTKTVEFIIPAGTGGGADQMARAIQGIVAKHNLMKQSMMPVNKSGGAGAEGFLDVKGAEGRSAQDHHHAVQPVHDAAGDRACPFNWRDLTPVQMLALDQFVLWVNADRRPTRPAKDYLDAVKAARAGDQSKRFKMGGTGAKQEDQIITAAIEQKTGSKFTYIPFKGGGDGGGAAGRQPRRLHGEQPDRSGGAMARRASCKPLCVFDPKRMPYKTKVTATHVLGRHPDLQGSRGLDVDYLMLRGIFMAPGVKPEHVNYYMLTCSRRCARRRNGRISWRRAPSTRPR